ncbi:MAG: hypothetical protein AAF840_18095, partial [Bacteroidota bacterium]
MRRCYGLLCGLVLMSVLNGQPNYVNVASQVGLQHTYISVLLGGGTSFYDFNGDGWDDITLATGFGEDIQFYLNTGGTFELLPPLVDN